MNLFGKLKSTALAVSCFIGALMPTAYADALDDCVALLQSNTYTIEYENITPPTRSKMHEKLLMTGGNSFVDPNPYTLYQPKAGFISIKGSDYYIETRSVMRRPNVSITSIFKGMFGDSDEPEEQIYEYASCRLVKNNEIFLFTRVTDNDKVTYTSPTTQKKGKVKAINVKRNVDISSEERFGDFETTRLLSAILPNDDKPEGTRIYQRVGSGTLSNGRSFFDLKAINPAENVFLDAIRYYFEGNRLVKIEAGQYFRDQFGKIDGVRTIINIHKFSSVADDSLLKLPVGLEDVTKRDQKGTTQK